MVGTVTAVCVNVKVKDCVDVLSTMGYIASKSVVNPSAELRKAIAEGPEPDRCNCKSIELTLKSQPAAGVIVNSMYLLLVTASGIETVDQLVALNRPPLADAVNPAPRVIVPAEILGSLELDAADASLPASAENSKVINWL